jgi:hypothetical protein
VPLLISNYAFSELNSSIQDEYLEKHLSRADHGMIISNSSIFAGHIGGRSDDELVSWLRSNGIPAGLEEENELLGPGDHLSGVRMIRW